MGSFFNPPGMTADFMRGITYILQLQSCVTMLPFLTIPHTMVFNQQQIVVKVTLLVDHIEKDVCETVCYCRKERSHKGLLYQL